MTNEIEREGGRRRKLWKCYNRDLKHVTQWTTTKVDEYRKISCHQLRCRYQPQMLFAMSQTNKRHIDFTLSDHIKNDVQFTSASVTFCLRTRKRTWEKLFSNKNDNFFLAELSCSTGQSNKKVVQVWLGTISSYLFFHQNSNLNSETHYLVDFIFLFFSKHRGSFWNWIIRICWRWVVEQSKRYSTTWDEKIIALGWYLMATINYNSCQAFLVKSYR